MRKTVAEDTTYRWLILRLSPLHSADHGGASRRAGTSGKSAFDVGAAETRATELAPSDTACVWAEKPVSPWRDSSGSPAACHPKTERKNTEE